MIIDNYITNQTIKLITDILRNYGHITELRTYYGITENLRNYELGFRTMFKIRNITESSLGLRPNH